MKKVYDIVLKAQLAAIDNVRAGIKGCDLDKIARDIITSEGYGDDFGHSLGHGVGVEIHEMPYAARSYTDPLPENSIVTVEPGIYLENEFGVRIGFCRRDKRRLHKYDKSPERAYYRIKKPKM